MDPMGLKYYIPQGEIKGSDFLFQHIASLLQGNHMGPTSPETNRLAPDRLGPSKRKLISLPRHPFLGATVDGSEIRLTTWDVYVNSGIFTISTGLPYQLVQVF